LFSELAFEVFLCLYFGITRRFMLWMQRELNNRSLKLLTDDQVTLERFN